MLGITRFGLAKMKESVLMLASVSCLQILYHYYASHFSLKRLLTTCLMLPFTGRKIPYAVKECVTHTHVLHYLPKFPNVTVMFLCSRNKHCAHAHYSTTTSVHIHTFLCPITTRPCMCICTLVIRTWIYSRLSFLRNLLLHKQCMLFSFILSLYLVYIYFACVYIYYICCVQV